MTHLACVYHSFHPPPPSPSFPFLRVVSCRVRFCVMSGRVRKGLNIDSCIEASGGGTMRVSFRPGIDVASRGGLG